MKFDLTKAGFRNDINGLRAWAVMSVVLFHFLVPGFSGGFTGVDIFFVISGYLMTDIIVSGLAQNKFSFRLFYLARAKRIIPALYAMILLLLGAGWFFLPTPDYQELASQANYALAFISNIDFAGAAGYFDSEAHEKWLLHTWSLAAEWQFYLLFPVFLWLAFRLLRGNITALFISIAALFLLSLGYSIYISPQDPNAAFYLLPARAWEMAAGGLVFFFTRWQGRPQLSTSIANVGYAVGWLLMIMPFVFFHAELVWPGAWALLPVIGTMLVLGAARQNNPMVSHPIAQWLGTRSYSIYLWHWPFAVLLFFMGMQNSVPAVIGAILASLLLGDLSYRLIENPVRILFYGRRKRALTAIFVTALVVCAVPAQWVRGGDLPERLPANVEQLAGAINDINPRRSECLGSSSRGTSAECTYGGAELGLIVLGDSHGGSVVRTAEAALPHESLHVLDWTMTGCPAIEGIRSAEDGRYRCAEFIDFALERSEQLPADVPMLMVNRFAQYVIGRDPMEATGLGEVPEYYISEPYAERTMAFFQEFSAGITATACEFAEDRHVFMLKPTPEMPVSVPQRMARTEFFQGKAERVSLDLEHYYARQSVILTALEQAVTDCGVTLLDPVPIFCQDGVCWGDKAGLPIYFDDDHLNEYGASFLKPVLMEIFAE
ncbi:Putative acyltransferase [Idiomarina sp. A28L]|uniref:acyltransferase family protein n=1 Tax=Idiomarina sp. A28L TaxID=1036674 RepID=UPI000213867E|nr:acyltransferase family protein [Idiomarina sp. A28L]EGN74782.1 Putative acyltransferase [Idiomarina sp. A28L]